MRFLRKVLVEAAVTVVLVLQEALVKVVAPLLASVAQVAMAAVVVMLKSNKAWAC